MKGAIAKHSKKRWGSFSEFANGKQCHQRICKTLSKWDNNCGRPTNPLWQHLKALKPLFDTYI
jgi:hypothetical protein